MRFPLGKGAIALAVFLLLGLAYAYGGRVFGPGGGRPAVSVTGTIEAIQVDVSAKIAGRIVERPLDEGDRVATGRLLVRLDDAEQTVEVRRQEAAVRTAEATLNDLRAGARREEMADARAALQSATATRDWTERDYRRAEQLFRQALIAAQEVDRARQAYEVALAQEKSARQKLQLLGLLFPIEGMPTAAQYLAAIIPLTYFLRIVRGIVLKGVGFGYLWPSLIPLLIFGAAVFSLAVLKFRKQLD